MTPCRNPLPRSRDRWSQSASNMSPARRTTAVLIVLACLISSSCAYTPYIKSPVPKPLAVRIQPHDLPSIMDMGYRVLLKEAAKKDLSALSRLDHDQSFQFGGINVKVSRLKATVLAFLQLLDEDLSPHAFQYELLKQFDFYKIKDDAEADDECSKLLVTGYFQPELQASLLSDSRFVYPIYGVPNDLVRVKLRDFGPDLPSVTIWGRISDHGLVPYYTRQEIDSGSWSNNAPVLAWLASPIDSLMLHIQGSGVLRFEDGSRRFVHYAASNGLPYRSVANWLIGHGFLNDNQADWPHIRAWAEANPDRFKDALASNPRYIFFNWEKDGPTGSLGEVLTPLISVALDPAVYPPGVLCLIRFDSPQPFGFYRERGSMGFVFNQDTGAAIKGPHRLDLYCGTGDQAGEIAGRLKARAELYIMLVKTSE
ncbi:MAG: murein transglycosylase A [Dissulfurimicrobium sp.]|uniref:murein transglycosylase A n=1 Tax=Dissulfurimicrobium sp. TaxID=2022436 RepID=UPI004048EDAD